MKKIVLATAFALSQVFVASAFAQTAAPAARAEVKAETKEAVKSGDIAKGEASNAPKAKSTAARADVKKEAASAEKSGTSPPARPPRSRKPCRPKPVPTSRKKLLLPRRLAPFLPAKLARRSKSMARWSGLPTGR